MTLIGGLDFFYSKLWHLQTHLLLSAFPIYINVISFTSCTLWIFLLFLYERTIGGRRNICVLFKLRKGQVQN